MKPVCINIHLFVYIYTNAFLNISIDGSFTKKEGLQPVFLCRVRRIVKHGTVPGSSFEPNSPRCGCVFGSLAVADRRAF